MTNSIQTRQAQNIATALIEYLKKNNQLEMLPELLKEAKKETKKYSDENTAHVYSAVELSDGEKKEIKETLESNLKKTLDFKTYTDSELIGGIKIRIGDKVIDYSISNKIDQLKASLV